jgi:hypothetical protein
MMIARLLRHPLIATSFLHAFGQSPNFFELKDFLLQNCLVGVGTFKNLCSLSAELHKSYSENSGKLN